MISDTNAGCNLYTVGGRSPRVKGGFAEKLIGSRLHGGRGVVDTLIDAGWRDDLICGGGMERQRRAR